MEILIRLWSNLVPMIDERQWGLAKKQLILSHKNLFHLSNLNLKKFIILIYWLPKKGMLECTGQILTNLIRWMLKVLKQYEEITVDWFNKLYKELLIVFFWNSIKKVLLSIVKGWLVICYRIESIFHYL